MENEDVYFELKQELKKILKQKNNYSYNYIKEKLGFINDDKLILLFLDIISDTLDNFNFLTPVYYNKFIFKIFEYLNIRNDKFEIVKNEEIVLKLENLNKKIKKIIKKDFILPNDSMYISNKALLLNISCQTSCIISKFNITNDIDLESIEYELYNILNELIFKTKKSLYIEEMFDIYPGISKIKNKDNNLLFKEVLDKYINVLLNRDDNYELIYYNKIIVAFINNADNINDYEIKDILISKIEKILSTIDDKDLSNYKKEKIIFFLGELKNLIKENNKEKIPYCDKINNVRAKYELTNCSSSSYVLEKPNWKLYRKSKAYAVTIDGKNSKTLENALSLDITNNSYKLTIYVIDMAAYIKENGITEKLLIDKAMSIKGYPLFPTNLANKNFSLKKGKYSYVIAYTFNLDKNMQVINFKVDRKMIKVKANLTHEQVNNVLNSKENTRLKKEVCQLCVLSDALNKINKGSKTTYHEIKDIVKVLLYNHEQNIKNNFDLDIVGEYHRFLNSFIAKYCYENNLPYIFRNNNFDSSLAVVEEIKQKYKNDESLKEIIDLLRSIYEPSTYSTENKGHTGLNLEAYGEITKPCRSVVSIINQRLTIDYFINGLYVDDSKRTLMNSKLSKMADKFNKQRELYDSYSLEVGKIKRYKKH